MLSHITIGVAEPERAQAFYGPLLQTLGWRLKFAEASWAGWRPAGAERPLFIVTRPVDGREATTGNGSMTALLADTRALVDEGYALALALGGRDEGAPGLRPHYHPHYYGAYFRDPDGNKLCLCCHAAP